MSQVLQVTYETTVTRSGELGHPGKGHNIYNTRHNKQTRHSSEFIFQTRHSSEFIFQDADLIISRIDPDRAGLLSFPAFCRGVATLMSSDIEMGPGE